MNQIPNSEVSNNQNGMFWSIIFKYDRTDRKTCNKSITFLLEWLRFYLEFFQIHVKNETKTETKILQKHGCRGIFSESSVVRRQMPDQASGLSHCWAPLNSYMNYDDDERCPPLHLCQRFDRLAQGDGLKQQ